MLPAEAGASGQAYYFERRNPMQKNFDKLDDYTDTRPSRLMEGWKWLMPRLIAAAAIVIILAYCAVLEVM